MLLLINKLHNYKDKRSSIWRILINFAAKNNKLEYNEK